MEVIAAMGAMVTDNSNMDLHLCNTVIMATMEGLLYLRMALSAVCLVHRLLIRPAMELRWAVMVGPLSTKTSTVTGNTGIMGPMGPMGTTGIMDTMDTMGITDTMVGERPRGYIYEL